MTINKFPNNILKDLKYYVYLYSHPLTQEIFYVGKGKGNRVFAHLTDEKESNKTAYLKELQQQELTPKIEILIHGLEDEETALRVEASIIDLLGIDSLTNKQSGWKSATYGRMTIEQIISVYDKQEVNIEEPSILIRINQFFRYSMTPTELYDFTRAQWKVKLDRAEKARFAFAVYDGIIQEVYQILQWHPAGSTFNSRQSTPIEGRYEFVGNIAPEAIRKRYRYKSVRHYFKKGNANPIFYLNC